MPRDGCPEPITLWSEAFAEELNVKLISTHELFFNAESKRSKAATRSLIWSSVVRSVFRGQKILLQLLRRRQDVLVQAIEIEALSKSL